jgi:hypothetical protein
MWTRCFYCIFVLLHTSRVKSIPHRVRRFRKKNCSLQAKQSETRSVKHVFCTLTRTNNFFLLLFASNFSLPVKAKLIERILNYIHCVSLPTIRFASFSFCFCFISYSFCFRCENKRKYTFFASKRKNYASVSLYFASKQKWWQFFLQFRVISVLSKNDSSFLLLFRFILLQSENYGSFCFRFASFRFEAKMMAVFRFFLVLFLLHSIFVSLQISMFCTDAKQAK